MHLLKHLRQHGFTLLELMIVLAVAGILVAVAAPGFQTVIKTNRIDGYRNNLVNAFKLARSEAVHTQTPVTICASSDQTTCSGGGLGWAEGWIVFADLDSSNSRSVGNEPLIDVAYGNAALRTISVSNSVLFLSTGMRNGAGSITFEVCDVDTSSIISGKAVVISRIGAASFAAAPNC